MLGFLVGCFVGTVIMFFAFAMCRAAAENDAAVRMEMRGRCSVCGRVISPDGRCPTGCGYQPAGDVLPSKPWPRSAKQEPVKAWPQSMMSINDFLKREDIDG